MFIIIKEFWSLVALVTYAYRMPEARQCGKLHAVGDFVVLLSMLQSKTWHVGIR